MKRKHYLLIAALSLSLTATAAAATLTACGEDDEPPYVQIKEDLTGKYYFDENGAERTIEIGINSFMLDFGEGAKFGSYVSYEDGTVSLLFDNSETATAVFNSGILTLYYNGRTYTLYAKKDFTVSFDVDGGSAVSAQTVTNGRKASRPANPTKNDSVFIGWYTDNTYTKQFDFDTAITENVTIYAKFVTRDASFGVYKAQFDLGNGIDASYPAVKTVNRVLYGLPEAPAKDGNKFLGWWVSNYYDGEKLSTKYEGQELYEDTVLYAVWESDKPAVSVTPTGASWAVKGTNKLFEVAVKDDQGNVLKSQQNASTSIAFDFSAEDAGDYTVEVTVDGQTSVAYYKNKALARVSGFNVEDDFFSFNAIEASDKYLLVNYYLDLECGDVGHTHVHEKLEATGYDFSNCRMKTGGLKFRITAEAVGYASSVSEAFTLERGLEKVTNLSIDEENDKVTWDAVENARSYNLELSSGTETITKTVVTNSFDLRSLKRGNWTIKVTPFNYTYNTPEAAETSYNKVRLASPTNLTVTDEEIAWDAVEGATGYTLFVNDVAQSPDLSTNSFTIPEGLFDGENTEFKVTVVALGATDEEKSLASDAVYIHGELGDIDYTNGVVSWDAVTGIQKYGVKVGDADEIFVTDGSNRANIVFTNSGNTVITVTCYVNGNEEADSNTTEVTVYAVTFDTLGGTKIDKQYKAAGDTLTLPEENPTRLGYEFVGWYDQEENGGIYADNSPFDADKPTVYARWKANKYNVNLVVGDGGTLAEGTVTSFEVTFGSSDATYPVPECTLEGKEFLGWFTAANGGVQITDNNGFAAIKWNIAQDTTLYAQWGYSGVSYLLSTNGREYYATKGEGITSLSTVTVLANYKGLPVTAIAADAFDGCATVKKLRIPSSLRTIFLAGDGGPYMRGSSFFGMSSLEEVEVYNVGGERFFDSVNGVLYSVADGEINEIVYVPAAMRSTWKGTFTVAEGTKRINCRVLSSLSETEEIVIPSSVVFIDDYALASNHKLQKITFLPTANGELGEALEIRDMFQYSNNSLVEITFPKRLASLNVDSLRHLTNLKNVYVQELSDKKDRNTNYYDIDGVLCKADELVSYPAGRIGAYTTPSGIARIGEKAFKGSAELTSIKFIASVTYIGIEAFSGCSMLTKIDLDQHAANSDLTIDEKAFYGCSMVRELTLPPSLKKLGKGAFGGLTLLLSVTVNANRESLEYADGAFATLTSAGVVQNSYVEEVTFGAGVQEMNISGVFGSKLEKVTVHENNPYYYEEDDVVYNSDLTSILFFPDGKTEFVAPDNMEIIASGVFKDKTTLTSVTIGTGIKKIETSAFEGCFNLETLIFKEGGTASLEIKDRAFYQCNSLKNVVVNGRGGAEITIGDYAFSAKTGNGAPSAKEGFDELTLPEGVKSIGRFAFEYRTAVKVVNLPASLETIGMLEVKDRYPVDSYDNEIKSIGVNNISIFRGCGSIEEINVASGNANYASVDGVLYAKEDGVISTLLYVGQKAKGGLMPDGDNEYGYLAVPETVTKIADFAFSSNGSVSNGIKKIVFNGTHTSFTVGNSAFKGASALESIALPSGMSEIAEGLFQGCSKLKEVEIPNTVSTILQKAFASCTTLEKVTFATGNDENKLVIEDGVLNSSTGGGQPSYSTTGAFYNCTSLKEIKFPARLESIGNYTFYVVTTGASIGKSTLKTVEIPVGVTRIGDYAFRDCTKLDSLTFTGTVTEDTGELTIGAEAFLNCPLPATFELPKNTVTLGRYALKGSGLTKLVVPAGLKTLEVLGIVTLTEVEFETKEVDGKQVSGLTDLPVYVVSNKSYSAFCDLTLLTDVNLEVCTNLKVIPANAFLNSALTSVEIPAQITEIGVSAFDGSRELASVTFLTDANGKSKVAKIGDYAFRNTALEEFAFPTLDTGTITLGTCLFENCGLLTDLSISASVRDLGSSLTKAPNLQNFDIHEDSGIMVDSASRLILGKTESANNTYKVISAFSAVALDANGTFTVPETYNGGTVVEIADSALAGQNAMKKVVIHNQIQAIGNKAFDQCRSLQAVEFESGSTCQSIGEYAFRYTISLDSIVIPNSVKSIGQRCFELSALTEVTMPDELTTAGANIFRTCVFLETVNNFSKLNLSSTPTNYDASYMFYECYALKNVTFASGADKLPTKAFYECTGLEKIDLTGITGYVNTSGKSYSEQTFYKCSALEEIVFDKDLTTLATGMFSSCTALTSIYRSDTAKADRVANKIDLSQITTVMASSASDSNGLFKDCTSIQEVDIRNVTTFGPYNTFQNCTSLQKVTLAGTGYATLVNNMFKSCSALKTVNYWNGTSIVGNDNEVTLQDNITHLGTNTFESTGITKITIPNNVVNIGSSATVASVSTSSNLFLNCAQLKEVVLPSGLEKLGAYVFKGCTVLDTIKVRSSSGVTGDDEAITLPSGLNSIGNYCFQGCEAITEIDLSNVTALGTSGTQTSNVPTGGLFFGCTNLSSVTLKSSTTTIGACMFAFCTSLETITLPSSLVYIQPFAFYGSGLTEITIPSTVSQIGTSSLTGTGKPSTSNVSYVFAKCEDLETVNVTTNLQTLGGTNTFLDCTKLTAFNITGEGESKLTQIGTDTFKNCSALQTISLPKVTSFGTTPFAGCAALENVTLLATTLPVNVFDGCALLTTVTLSGELTTLSNYAFSGCTSLKTIYRSDTAEADRVANTADLSALTSIGTRAFQNCKALTSVKFNDNMTSIGDTAFYGCSSLDDVTLPSALTSISNQAFLSCSSLSALEIPAGVTSLGTNLFVGCNNLTLTVAAANTTFEINANGWLVKKDGTVYYIPRGAEGANVTEVNFAEGAKLYGYMFNGYSDVQKITLPSDLTSIPAYAFWNFAGSFGADFAIPQGVTSIGAGAFQNSTITEIVIPEGITTIPNYAFANCTNLTKITLPSTLTSIGTNAFQGCTSLAQIVYTAPETAPASFIVNNNAFDGCSSLTSVPFDSQLTAIQLYVFQNCTSLESFNFGDNLTNIGRDSFMNTGLTGTLTLKGSFGTSNLGINCFKNCTGIEKVVFETSNVLKLNDDMFTGCTSLKSIKIPYTVTQIGKYVFQGCVSLNSVVFEEAPEGTAEVALTFATSSGSASLNNNDGTYYYESEFGTYFKSVFAGCTALKSINLPSRITEIPVYCFVGSGLESIVIPESVTKIDTGAFMFTPLKSVTIPRTVATLNNIAFGGCTELTTVVIEDTPDGETVTKLALGAGSSSAAVATGSVYYSEEAGLYYSGVFVGCTKLKNVTLASRITSISKCAFSYTNIEEIDLAGIVTIGESAFEGCKLLSEVTMPSGTTTINATAFKNCSALASLTLPETITTINANILSGTAITEIRIPITAKCQNNAFADWTEEQTILIDLTGAEFLLTADSTLWTVGAFTTNATIGVYLPE